MGTDDREDVYSVVAPEPIAEFNAFVARVQTLADGSPRVTLDMSEERVDLLTTLARTHTDGQMITVLVFDAEKWQEYTEDIKKHQNGTKK
jgi:hypothetical protein